jgi:inorganic pyrophosphatase
MWNDVEDITQLPQILVERLQHYFSTYKLVQGATAAQIRVQQVYGHEYAARVVTAAMTDYETLVGDGK